jgi:hypothetical protein
MATATPAPQSASATDVPAWMVRALSVGFVILACLLAYLMAAFWPVMRADGKGEPCDVVTLLGVWTFHVATEVRLIWLVVIAASLGSYVHTVTSFTSYIGNRTFVRSWLWWYILRTPMGVALALIFYFVVRGGLFSSSASGNDISPFGVAAISGMVGMFAKQATDKLQEVFDNLFRTKAGDGDDGRADKLLGHLTIDSIAPATVTRGSNPTPLSVKGRGFLAKCQVTINGESRTTEFKSSVELAAQLTAADMAAPCTLAVAVQFPGPPARVSNSVQLVVQEPV